MHSYTVELRILGQDLDPDEATLRLGVEPSQIRRKGERLSDRCRPWDENMWAFEVFPPGQDSWQSLEEGLSSLLSIVGPIRDKILAYAAANEICIWCGHFTSSFDGGPILSPRLLKSLGDFGVQLILDTYCDRESESSEGNHPV